MSHGIESDKRRIGCGAITGLTTLAGITAMTGAYVIAELLGDFHYSESKNPLPPINPQSQSATRTEIGYMTNGGIDYSLEQYYRVDNGRDIRVIEYWVLGPNGQILTHKVLDLSEPEQK